MSILKEEMIVTVDSSSGSVYKGSARVLQEDLMRIVMGSDHGGAELRIELIEYIKELGHDVTDFGVELGEKADYPNIGIEVAKEVANGNFECGILSLIHI